MRQFQQNDSRSALRDIFVQMVDENDFVTAVTGLIVTPDSTVEITAEIVKAGESAYISTVGVFTEIGDGTYKLSLAAADIDTLGQAQIKIEGDGCATQFIPIEVVDLLQIDSTGTETITTAKALEAILAAIAGQTAVSDVDSDTKLVKFLGRDGATTILEVQVSTTTAGLREGSDLDPS